MKQYNRAVVTDFDGTLYHREWGVTPEDRETLLDLGNQGILRCIATGRSHYALMRAISPDFPIDYLIFSSGAGIMDFRTGDIVWSTSLSRGETGELASLFIALGYDFMIHLPIPENHRFRYHDSGRDNPDFLRRLSLYADCAVALDPSLPVPYDGEAAQFLIVEPSDARVHADLVSRLGNYTVIRTTSPLDKTSVWVEVFPRTVSKSQCAERLMRRIGMNGGALPVLALGNDWNDEDLLDWAGTSYIAPGAPEELAARFPTIPGGPAGFFTRAVRSWLSAGINGRRARP